MIVFLSRHAQVRVVTLLECRRRALLGVLLHDAVKVGLLLPFKFIGVVERLAEWFLIASTALDLAVSIWVDRKFYATLIFRYKFVE